MYSKKAIHESHSLRQARRIRQYVDLSRNAQTTPSCKDDNILSIIHLSVNDTFSYCPKISNFPLLLQSIRLE